VRYFVTRFLQQADEFVSQLDQKSANKVFYNIDLAEQTNDQKLFKKLKGEIWEFRSKYLGSQNRLLAFWDKTEKNRNPCFSNAWICKENSKNTSKRN